MRFKDYKLVFVVVSLTGILLSATPTMSMFLSLPSGEQFSELYVLGPERMAENYPFNIVPDQNHSVYIGVGNHLGCSAYYVLYVKFRNQTDLLPNAATGTPSPLQPLYEYRLSIKDGENWEKPLTFSVSNASISANQSVIRQLMINGDKFDVVKPGIWDSNSSGFFYQLVFELWLYDVPSDLIQFNNRYVSLQLNLTRSTQSQKS
jgi:hypothetical protein